MAFTLRVKSVLGKVLMPDSMGWAAVFVGRRVEDCELGQGVLRARRLNDTRHEEHPGEASQLSRSLANRGRSVVWKAAPSSPAHQPVSLLLTGPRKPWRSRPRRLFDEPRNQLSQLIPRWGQVQRAGAPRADWPYFRRAGHPGSCFIPHARRRRRPWLCGPVPLLGGLLRS